MSLMSNKFKINYLKFNNNGFTLVELLVVLFMLSVFLVMAMALFNPLAQIGKAKDAQKKHDFEQVRNALDLYYNDYNCFPQDAQNADNPKNPQKSIPFGSDWKVNGTTYMTKVPQDPSMQYSYLYQTDGSSCPQWVILYGKLEIAPADADSCNTNIIKKMCPSLTGIEVYNYCVPIGQINCGTLANAKVNSVDLSSNPVSTSIPTSTPAQSTTPAPTSAPTASPTPSPTPAHPDFTCSSYFAISNGKCNAVSRDQCRQFIKPYNPFSAVGDCYSTGGTTDCGAPDYHYCTP